MPSSSPTPNSQPAALRKIDLTYPADLTYLATTGRSAALTKLESAFPADATTTAPDAETDEDSLRARVSSLLDAFVAQTYAGVRANATANGVDLLPRKRANGDDLPDWEDDADSEDEARFEPFDPKLAERIRALEAQKQSLTERVADLRRTGPKEAAERWQAEWEASALEVDVVPPTDVGAELQNTAPSDEQMLDIGPLPRWDDVQRMHARGLDGLVALKAGMAGTAGKLAEAKEVGEALEGAGHGGGK